MLNIPRDALGTQEFDPVQFLKILKKNIELFDVNDGQKQKLYSRIDDIMKDIKKGRIDKAREKAEQFIKILDNNYKYVEEIQKISSDNIKMLFTSLNKLLVNLNTI